MFTVDVDFLATFLIAGHKTHAKLFSRLFFIDSTSNVLATGDLITDRVW